MSSTLVKMRINREQVFIFTQVVGYLVFHSPRQSVFILCTAASCTAAQLMGSSMKNVLLPISQHSQLGLTHSDMKCSLSNSTDSCEN